MKICDYQNKEGGCEYVKIMARKLGFNSDKEAKCNIKTSDLYLYHMSGVYLLRSNKCAAFKPANGLEEKLRFKPLKDKIFDAYDLSLNPSDDEEDYIL